jgi:hypothetical protein
MSDTNCVSTHYCAADGTCKPRKANGASCNLTTECRSGGCRVCSSNVCTDGVCCGTSCSSACDVCIASLGSPLDGVCGPASVSYSGSPSCGAYACNGTSTSCPSICSLDAHCAPTHYCSVGGTCQPRKLQGAVCNSAAGADCLTAACRVCSSAGGCVDGVCCDTACAGACNACSVAAGATTNGTCVNRPKGAAGAPSCAPFTCSGGAGCATTCASDSDCAANGYCDATSGTCKTDEALGSACSRTAMCASGFCVDGVCCDELCSGTCRACAAALKTDSSIANNGRCVNAADGLDPHSTCAADPTSTCQQDGACDGVGGCRKYAKGTACGATVCIGGDIVSGQVCDGLGA